MPLNQELQQFTQELSAQVAAQKAADFRMAAKSEANYEAFITEVTAIISSAVVEFITTRQMTTADLVEYNRERITDLDAWVRSKLAEIE